MSQRTSGYARRERDDYYTPEWVTETLLPHLPPFAHTVWEPACGSGKMVSVLRKHGLAVCESDIDRGVDFLKVNQLPDKFVSGIITNPPFYLATEFIEHALELMKEPGGFVCMLLRTDFDHAKSRQHLFRENISFAKKLVLLKRIKWFENSTGSPSYNHAWFIWDHRWRDWPRIDYGP